MTDLDKTSLLKLVNNFIEGKDCSVSIANEIEVVLDDAFPDDEFMQDTVLMLASYRPGGGEFLYDEQEVKSRLRTVRERLNRLQ